MGNSAISQMGLKMSSSGNMSEIYKTKDFSSGHRTIPGGSCDKAQSLYQQLYSIEKHKAVANTQN